MGDINLFAFQFYITPKPERAGATFITKKDDALGKHRISRVSYTVPTNITVVMHFKESVPEYFVVTAVGLERFVLSLCIIALK